MKINAASILGVCVAAAGVLLMIAAMIRSGDPSASATTATAEASTVHSSPYLPLGIGVLVFGIIIVILGQYFKRSPDPTDPL